MFPLLFRTVGWIFAAFFVFKMVQGMSGEIRNAYRRNWVLALSTALLGFLVLAGMGGFLAQWLVGTGALALPKYIEWPVGKVKGVARTPDGKFVVPLVPQSRVQLYDARWKFLLGWNVDTGGKDFTVKCRPDGVIELIRSTHKYSFSQNGDLLSEENVDAPADTGGSVLSSSSQSVTVPTPAFLWILTSPFFSWVVGVLGLAGLTLVGKVFGLGSSKARRFIQGEL